MFFFGQLQPLRPQTPPDSPKPVRAQKAWTVPLVWSPSGWDVVPHEADRYEWSDMESNINGPN